MKKQLLDNPEIQVIDPFDIQVCPSHSSLEDAQGCHRCRGIFHKSKAEKVKDKMDILIKMHMTTYKASLDNLINSLLKTITDD